MEALSNSTLIGYQSGNSRVNELTDALGFHSYVAYYSPGASQCGSNITTLPCTTFQDANSHITIYGYNGLQVQDVVDSNDNLVSVFLTKRYDVPQN